MADPMHLREKRFKSWLRRKPRPNRVRATCEDGTTRTITINAQQGGTFWADTIETLESLQPVRVEALDAAGDTIRAIDITTDEEEEGDDSEVAAPVTATPVVSASDDGRLVAFARLLAEAYRNGADAQRASSDVAFSRLVELTNVAFQRLDSLERAYSRSFSERLREQAADGAQQGGGDFNALLMAMMQGMAQAQAGKPAPADAVANGVKGEA